MIAHVLIVDDEEEVLEALVPSFVKELGRRLAADRSFRRACEEAGSPLPASGPVNFAVSAAGYASAKVPLLPVHRPVHLRLWLCCDKGGSFRHALRLLKEHLVAVVVSDLRFSDDAAGARAGQLLVEDVQRRNPRTYCVLYSAYQRPEGFPPDRFVRKGSATNLGGEALAAQVVEGCTSYFSAPEVRRLGRELARRGLVYQSDAFGSVVRRLWDVAELYFGAEQKPVPGRRRPRPMLLLDGETGTGKTELAGLLHQLSDRRTEPFVAATCNQLTDETFLRSILFGHVKGSFTGAAADRKGLVETAGGGILLLDDLHMLREGTSTILHSFLDDGEYCHLGQDEQRRSAACAVVATVESPRWEEARRTGRLADSFVHRVEQLVVRIPPLRARPEDIEHQARQYAEEFSRQAGAEMELSPAALGWLASQGFAGGNSRRLRDFVRGLVTHHARVTDYLDVAELEEYGRERGLAIDAPAAVPAAPGASASPSQAEPAAGEGGSWNARMRRLAARVLASALEISLEEATLRTAELFDQHLPRAWASIEELGRAAGGGAGVDLKLFDELLRYYVVARTGTPAKAAKELGMKDNALREFIYSREQRHEPKPEGSSGG